GEYETLNGSIEDAKKRIEEKNEAKEQLPIVKEEIIRLKKELSNLKEQLTAIEDKKAEWEKKLTDANEDFQTSQNALKAIGTPETLQKELVQFESALANLENEKKAAILLKKIQSSKDK